MHQLIRQYVMASLLVDRLGVKKQVVPFVVWSRAKGQRRPKQVNFMIQQGWLKEDNVLTWEDIEKL